MWYISSSMTCEMCGVQGVTKVTLIEGSQLNVCKTCAKYGTAKPIERERRETVRIEYELVPNFIEEIKSAREKSGFSQSQFAQQLGEKESTYQKWELGTLYPSIPVARKIERRLGLKLVQPLSQEDIVLTSTNSEEPTLADMVKIKTRK